MTTSAAAAAFSAAPAGTPPAASAPPAGTPPVGTPPAATPPAGTPPAGTPPAGAPPAAAWYDTFQNADVKTWTAAKGFKDPAAVAESAYNLEKLIGFDKAGRTLVIPKDDATPEEVKAFHVKLGVPETPDGYKLKLPDGTPEATTKAMQGWMHEAGVPPKSAEKLVESFVKFSGEQEATARAGLIADGDKAFAEQTSEWGKDAEANLELAKRFTAQALPEKVKLDNGTEVGRQEFLETLFNRTGATKVFLQMFAGAGKGLGEHAMRTNGEAPAGVMTPQQAQARIAALRADPDWSKAYVNGDKGKLAEMTKLNQLAYGGGGAS